MPLHKGRTFITPAASPHTDATAPNRFKTDFPPAMHHHPHQSATAHDMGRRAGFTLIELLVVIAIIAILAAIIVPTVRYTRQNADISTSVSNLRQISAAMNLFATEHDGYYPIGYYYQPGEGERIWIVELRPYINGLNASNKSTQNIFISPLAQLPLREGSIQQKTIPSTYSVHGLISGNTSEGDNRLPQSLIARPAEVILVAESSQRSNNGYANASFLTPTAFRQANSQQNLNTPIPTDGDTDGTGGALRYRARGAVPAAFVDGHVELMKKGTVKYGNIIADR